MPLDSHEIFVAQAAREMSLRGDWVVPYFNGVPRLNKPPMNYWLAGAVAGLAGDLPDVAAWHVRTVSVLAGLGLALATLWLGALCFDRATAFVAALLLVSSAGMFSFMHDARPDLLYACWIGLAVACGMAAQRGRAPRLWGALGLMWVCHAAATLTKGPHIPALVLLGTAIHLWRANGSVRAVARTLRPGAGLLIVAALCAPWWLAVALRLDAVTVEGSQVGGTLLMPALSRLGDPYYFYRPLQLLLPWLPLALGALLLAIRQRAAHELAVLWWPLLVTIVGLSLGRQYRFFYLLPLAGVLALLIARPLVRAAAARTDQFSRGSIAVTLFLQALLVAAAAVYVLQSAMSHGTLRLVVGWLAAAALCGGLIWHWLGRGALGAAPLAALAVGFALLWPAAAGTGLLWSQERYDSHALAIEARRRLEPGTPLATLGVSPTVFVYYSARPVQALNRAVDLAPLIAQAPRARVALIVRSSRLGELAPPLRYRELARARRGRGDDVLVLVDQAGGSTAH